MAGDEPAPDGGAATGADTFERIDWTAIDEGERGLDPAIVQCNISLNKKKGTVRGMHWQAAPHEEVKLVRCTSGAIHDVLLDLRPGSETWRQHVGVRLDAENRLAVYVPAGVAHGFQSLEDETEVFYQMSEFYYPESQRGVRWDDPAFEVTWPMPISEISERDLSFPDYETLLAETAGTDRETP